MESNTFGLYKPLYYQLSILYFLETPEGRVKMRKSKPSNIGVFDNVDRIIDGKLREKYASLPEQEAEKLVNTHEWILRQLISEPMGEIKLLLKSAENAVKSRNRK